MAGRNGGRLAALCTLVALVVATFALPATAQSNIPGLNVVTETRVVGDGTRTRFIADLTDETELTVFALSEPNRIVIDLPEVHFELEQGVGDDGRGLIEAYRYGLISRGKSRIVLDLTGPVRVDEAFVLAPIDDQPARLVVDLVPTDLDDFLATVTEYREAIAAANPPQNPDIGLYDNASDGRAMIVIDPGHGGIDSGAIGDDGTLEKEVVLEFAIVFAELLRATGRYEVAMTRTGDTFPSLTSRVDFAREHRADLFLSIHADWLDDSSVRGTAVYTVSERASDAVTAALANSQNRSDLLAGVELANAPSEVADILIDLARRETNNFSILLARDLLDSIDDVTALTRSPHRQAGFVVLTAPDVPSALIELGFLSNADDERNLLSTDWQRRTAAAMVAAIDRYFATRVARQSGP